MATTADTFVVDASMAVKWHLNDEEHAEAAAHLLTRFGRGELTLLAPDHIRYEVPAAITVATIGTQPRLTIQEGQEAIEEFLALGLTTVGTDDLILAAYPLVHRYNIALYDALYVAPALRSQCSFVTADRRLYQRIRQVPGVVWVSDSRLS